eukprot:CAMPEP_0204564518 /NCGR_PEP_ID=MMETSP0661-20131031/34934_1 /ASSEMBLY_ACC=CAM_ASM_000606 /TAXON_ID=109239 /ORGANISM="Alexandrium margalefi, Strain AMGDE01CS-322" /LENGTH=35 /DNA_ID= /DNA_START= /DNA_END= /DNA_ORIENTATION=
MSKHPGARPAERAVRHERERRWTEAARAGDRASKR